MRSVQVSKANGPFEIVEREIARILQVDKSIVCRDIAYLRQQSKTNIIKNTLTKDY
jgi:hypothetical protein